jgi:hypothetical protein
MKKPITGEYNPYFDRYISLVLDGDFQQLLKENTDKTIRFFEGIPPEKHDHRYANNKWSIKESLMHIIDTERVMSYRAFVAIRADNTTVLCDMDENRYAANADVCNRTLAGIIAEFAAVRSATTALYAGITEAQSAFRAKGTTYPFTARALGYIMIGHVEHHFNVISQRYL